MQDASESFRKLQHVKGSTGNSGNNQYAHQALERETVYAWSAWKKPLLSKNPMWSNTYMCYGHWVKGGVVWPQFQMLQCVSWKPNSAFENKNLMPTVTHDGSVMVWGCFAASGLDKLAIIIPTIKSTLYQREHEENVRPSVKKINKRLL